MRLILILAVMAITASCASRKPAPAVRPAPVSPVVEVMPLIERGCYRCLEEAFAVASTQRQTDRAFEAAVLLVLRSKELGMSADAWVERARAIAGANGAWTQLLQMINAVPPDPLGGDREAMLANPVERSRIRAMLPMWRDTLARGGGSPEFRTYLEL